MHDLRRPHDLAAEDLADALVPEAHAEHRDTAREMGDDLVGQPGILGASRAGADQHTVGLDLLDLVDRQGIAAVHERLGTQLAQVLDEVEHERVVVVEDEDPGGHSGADPIAWPPGPRPAFPARIRPPARGGDR